MNIHEYQGKALLESFGVSISKGIVANTPLQAKEAAIELQKITGTEKFAVKAQIHAGGRGKGGGVKIASDIDQVYAYANQILGMQLITPQTPPEGKKVDQVLIDQNVYYPGESQPQEFYMSVLLNRQTGKNMMVYSTEGGMDIEAVAEKTPELIFKQEVDPVVGFLPFQARKVAFDLGLKGKSFTQMTKFASALYNAFVGVDASLFEINPVFKTSDDKIMAIDCKVTLDNNALFRHKDFYELRDLTEEHPIEVEASQAGLNYVALSGNVGCMVNGAGLAMATMDLIKQSGGDPANFLDVGGTADSARVETGFRLILRDPKVKCILVNIFGGIVRCDKVAKGIVDAYQNLGVVDVPIIVRLQGTNADIAKRIISESKLNVHSAILFQEVADLVHNTIK
ncbi:MAG: ADP-forming succinate--CoA ligase subunit beta [Flavobacteriaceae bacterium]|nr:ADP-forming succinate--CoA ligase subunit beta [Flavobacteriaceae bacterium]MCY4216811.1 ADP-forming succinate--CoA ligase subunit beta [Flavobacteriaceae bacterium]MCY4253862.1 ADP-forming succinate--CoA ligase subunit beta [Flavobacteriaceae bacterium]